MAKIKKIVISEHLPDWLKSSYLDRLNWLEEANRFVRAVRNGPDKKRRAKLRAGLTKQ